MTPGEFFKKKRAEKGATSRSIGKAAGVSNVYVLKLEKGKSKPSLEVVHRLLRALDATWPEFLDAIGYIDPEK